MLLTTVIAITSIEIGLYFVFNKNKVYLYQVLKVLCLVCP